LQIEAILERDGQAVERRTVADGREATGEGISFAKCAAGIQCEIDIVMGVAVGAGESLLDRGARGYGAGLQSGLQLVESAGRERHGTHSNVGQD
jgi:hypothetical protein